MDERLLRDAGNKSSPSSLLLLNITSIFSVKLKEGSSEILMCRGCLAWGIPC